MGVNQQLRLNVVTHSMRLVIRIDRGELSMGPTQSKRNVVRELVLRVTQS